MSLGPERRWQVTRRLIVAFVAVFALLGVALQASAAFPTGAPASAPAAAPVSAQGLGAQSVVSQGKADSGQYDKWIQPSRPSPDDPFGVKGIDCSLVEKLHLNKQMNKWAGAVVDYCAGQSGSKAEAPAGPANVFERVLGPLVYGGVDKNLITQVETTTRNVQSESWVWGNGQTVVVTYNDSSSFATNQLLCGVSVSTDGGTTWNRIQPSPFTGLGSCSGDPFHFYSAHANKWYAHFFAGSCGNDIGQWESTDGITWTASGCVTSVGSQDRFSGWVDNNSGSPHYGTQYVSTNNFSVGGGALQLTRSTDDGVTWSPLQNLTSAFRRNVQMTGSKGTDGTVYVQSMDEGGGGLNGPRQNMIFRSTDGGATWAETTQNAATFLGPGRGVCGYFAGMYTTPVQGYWRHMGWGEPGVGPGGVVHYAYAARTTDPGDIYYIRSTDNGTTWSAPLKLNTDTTTRAQWMPSLSVSADGTVFVGWYDERNTTGDVYERFGRASLNNGLTWQADEAVSDVQIPKPLQPDTNIQTCYAGDYDYATADGQNHYQTWTDGRVQVLGAPQQDVFFDKVPLSGGTPTPTVTGTPPTNTPTVTRTPTVTPTSTPCAFATIINEGFETAPLGVFTATNGVCLPGGCNWVRNSTPPVHGGTYQAFAPDLDDISDQYLSNITPIVIPSGVANAELTFWHRYDLENTYDGGVLETSTNGGTSWQDAGSLITVGGYNTTISTLFESPIAGRQAWSGLQATYTQVRVNLSSFIGQNNFKIRFREANDNSVDAVGWFVDDVVLSTTSGCPSPPTATPTSTTAPSNTPTITVTPTGEASPTVTVCTIEFTDVPATNTFYPFVKCLACRDIISGYPCGGDFEPCDPDNNPYFRPNNPVTRGQIAKMVTLSAGFIEPIPTTQQTFEDVPYGSTFWEVIERLSDRSIIGGYQCGINPAEPCVPPENRPYFRPNAGATRGQLTKIASEAAGFTDTIPETQYTFTDVEPGHTFWVYIERLLINRPGAIGGYPCGGPGEPCDSENRPYFRPNNGVTRGQSSKIISNTFFPECTP